MNVRRAPHLISKHHIKRILVLLAIMMLVYIILAYLIMPRFWRHHEQHKALTDAPTTTNDVNSIPGDALNVGLVGTQQEVVQALANAGWQPADQLTFRSSIGIIESVLLREPDPHAPVSNLYLWGRVQDLAFEQEVGRSAKQRHHVRLWKAPDVIEGRPLWLGSATFDTGVELSHTTGQVTHKIAPAIDNERDLLMADLQQAGQVQRQFQTAGIGMTLNAHNAGGDWYYTDGERTIAVLKTR